MASFKDRDGHEWDLSLDGPTIKAVRSECDGVDLADLEGKSFAALVDDPCLLVDVLWVICRKQARERNVTDEQFGRALVGDTIESATAAMLESIADFFPTARRELVKAVAHKDRTLRKVGLTKALARINDPALEQRILDNLEARMDDEIEAALTRLNSATNTPASSGSPRSG